MTRLARLAVRLLLGYGFCGCTRTVETRAESTLQATQAVHEKASETIDETVRTGPSTTTVYKFALPEDKDWRPAPVANRTSAPLGVPNVGPKAHAEDLRPAHEVGATGPYGAIDPLPFHGPLVEMDVTQTGEILASNHAAAQQAMNSEASVAATTKTATKATTSYWPPWYLLAGGAGLLALAAWLLRSKIRALLPF